MDNTAFYKIKTPPSELPVTLDDVKAFLRVTTTVEDALISSLIESAVNIGENYCRRQFIIREWDAFFPCLKGDDNFPYLVLARSPFVDLSEVAILDNGNYVAVSSSDYFVKEKSSFSKVFFTNYDSLYSLTEGYPFRVTFRAGYGDALNVPEAIKSGIKAHVSFMYENRGDVQSIGAEQIPVQVKYIYNSYKIIHTF
jgi:uncharacterized phiE125 gp8 family phage protein